MMSDPFALERGLATGEPGNCRPAGVVAGVQVECFPDLCAGLAGKPPDLVIALSGSSGNLCIDVTAALPHPGPLPLGEGEVQLPIRTQRNLGDDPLRRGQKVREPL